MLKQLLGTLVGILVVTGIASATLILETDPATDTSKPNVQPTTNTKPLTPGKYIPYTRSSRPSLRDVLDRRPTLPASTHGAKNITGNVMTGTKNPPVTTGNSTVRPQTNVNNNVPAVRTVVKQDAEAVKAYRTERGYILRFLKRVERAEMEAMQEAVTDAIKTLLDARESMRRDYELAASTSNLMTESQWNLRAEGVIETYKVALTNYIDEAKMDAFEKFILGRTNLLKNYFEKLETIRKVKSQN